MWNLFLLFFLIDKIQLALRRKKIETKFEYRPKNTQRKKLSHKQVAYWASIYAFVDTKMFLLSRCATIASDDLIRHFCPYFVYVQAQWPGTINFWKRWIAYFHLLSPERSKLNCFGWRTYETRLEYIFSLLWQLFPFGIPWEETIFHQKETEAKIIKTKPLHMNDKNDAKTNDLCACIKSDSTRMG